MNSATLRGGWLLLMSALAMIGRPAAAEPRMPPDGWGGRNMHIAASAAIGAATNALDLRPLPAFGACMAVGVLREVNDYYKPSPGTRHGLFSRKDLVSDAAGCVIGYGIAEGVRVLVAPRGISVSMRF